MIELRRSPRFETALCAAALLASVAVTGCGVDAPAGADAATPADAVVDAVTADAGPTRPLEANDVSVLFPLAPASALWRVSLAGRGGPLLPAAVFEQIGRSLIRELTTAAAEYDGLRVVAFRYDPCFRHEVASTRCQPQVRLVAQAVDAAGGRAFDGAVHLLYHLDAADDAAVRRELAALTPMAPQNVGAPLGVSPALAASGLDGAYGQRLRALVARVAGAETLQRITFMSRTGSRAGQWEFGGMHVRAWPEGGVTAPGAVAIARLDGATFQTVVGAVSAGFSYDVSPRIGIPAGAPALTSASIAQVATGGPGAVRPLWAWARGVEDPAGQVADSVDCASCHLANRIGRYIERNHPGAVEAGAEPAPRVVGGAELENDNLRAFGYFEAHAAVAQRTANETAAVVAWLRAMP